MICLIFLLLNNQNTNEHVQYMSFINQNQQLWVIVSKIYWYLIQN